MDTSGQTQNVDAESSQVIKDCLSNRVVLSVILEHFSTTELLKLSIVNKLWNYEARSVMKKRGNVIASFLSDEPCQLLQSFGSIVSGMNVVPFSGMELNMNFGNHYDDECGIGGLDPIISHEILGRIPWTHFSVRIDGEWWLQKSCSALRLVKHVFHKYGCLLQELTIDLTWNGEEFVREIVQDCSFPRLKILKLGDDRDSSRAADDADELDIDYMKALVSRAPNLQEFHSRGPPSLLHSLMEVSSAVLVCSALVFATFDHISEGFISALRLKRMQLEYSTGPEFNFERFNRVAPMLLRASCTKTLQSLRIDAVMAVALMSYGVCLEKVNDLTMVINYSDWEPMDPRIFRLVNYLDFTRIFPNVNKVMVLPCMDWNSPGPHPDHTNIIVDQAHAVSREPLPDRAVNITEVHVIQLTFSIDTAQFYAEMFPCIKKLEVDVRGAEEIPFGSIWKNWADLKQLVISQNGLEEIRNLDSVFCGIFPEEVAELREKDEDYLLSVNIVPVMPAIICLRNLKTFSLHYRFCYGVTVTDPTLIFSKVTVLTAFARCPNLRLLFNFPVENLQRAR